jgi:hypothetical protein
MRWPVLDPEIPPRDLIAEAVADLGHELPLLGLIALSSPVFTWAIAPKLHRHSGTFLVARLAVRDVVRVPDSVQPPAVTP